MDLRFVVSCVFCSAGASGVSGTGVVGGVERLVRGRMFCKVHKVDEWVGRKVRRLYVCDSGHTILVALWDAGERRPSCCCSWDP